MRKLHIRKAAILLLLFAVTISTVAPIRYAKDSAGNWMAELEDTRKIHTLTIPGTHDSGALYSFAGLFGKCQTLNIAQQLEAGVRFLDLRLRLVGDELHIYHNFVEQKSNFQDVLADLTRYIQENPTEFLIISIKEEASPIRSEQPFAEAVEAMLGQHPEIVCTDHSIPETVGEARGKIYLLARYQNSTMGIPCNSGWQDNTAFTLGDMYVQDHYRLQNAEEKMPDIMAAFEVANSGKYRLVLNYTSCYLTGSFPPAYAGTPAHRINPWLQTSLQEAEGPLGILVTDFITSELARDIIGRNFT